MFHAGFYSGMNSEEAGVKIAEGILEMQEYVKKEGWDVELCPEVMGKVNVFGSIDEIGALVEATGCGACVDIAHVLARYGRYEFEKMRDVFRMKNWHVHFSGIEFGAKGERKHLVTPVEGWEKVLGWLKKLDKDVVLICESPDAVSDSVVGMRVWGEMD